jgi:leucyl aminopeptidase
VEITLNFTQKISEKSDLVIVGAFNRPGKDKKDKDTPIISAWPKEYQEIFKQIKSADYFTGKEGESFYFHLENGASVMAWGLGKKEKVTAETMRRQLAKIYKEISKNTKNVTILFDSFSTEKKFDIFFQGGLEGLIMTSYSFDKYKSTKTDPLIKGMEFHSSFKKKKAKAQKLLEETTTTCESINFARSLVNEPPSFLNSEVFAKEVEKDAKKLARVKIKIMGKADLKKEKMGMFLGVNAGSAFDPKLVHLTYTPAKASKKTKHIALVGKGLTFDTGGYNLKPSGSIANMKFDMAGAATVYGAFRAAVLKKPNIKISCFLGMTDNMINSHATLPDSVLTARNGKTVEILNTDAEGRLVLGDVLDYACDQKPHQIIDAATLTGAVLVSLGSEVCGVMGNDQKMVDKILKTARDSDEYAWQLPIIDEFRNDMKGNISDLKNIGSTRFGGTPKAAAFLENFIKDDISWAHLDIAGVGDSQSHLPYCPAKGASGLMIRTLTNYLTNG